MGLFGDMARKVLGAFGGGGGEMSGLVKMVMEMLTSKESGGLAGLMESFNQKGLGGIFSSWISTGKNLPISAEQIQHGLGMDQIRRISDASGLPADDVKSKLAEVLPDLIDKLTPEGRIPEGGLQGKAMDILKKIGLA
jgi:uncharacterized protein YidB (DUF937 family)